jgi:CubicO group peptidase (beta-lactamase class C family)
MNTSLNKDRSRREFLRASPSGGAFARQPNLLRELVGGRWPMTPGAEPEQRKEPVMNGNLSVAALQQMHDVMSSYMTHGDVPGLVTLVARGEEVHVDALGTVTISGTEVRPVRRDTIFRIASMTKAITAIATLMLIEEAKLKLDEPVDRLLPELANRKVLKRPDGPIDDTVPAKRAITVRDLLTFRLGTGLLLADPATHPIVGKMYELHVGELRAKLWRRFSESASSRRLA